MMTRHHVQIPADELARKALGMYGDTGRAHAYLMGMFDALFDLDTTNTTDGTRPRRDVILAAAERVNRGF